MDGEDNNDGASTSSPKASTKDIQPPSRQKRRGLRLAILAIVAVWFGACAVLGLSARADITTAEQRVSRAQSNTLAEMLDGKGINQLRKAESELRKGHDTLSSPVFAPLRVVPVIGRQISSARALSKASFEALDAGLDALVVVRETIDKDGVAPEGRPAMLATLANEASKAHGRLATIDLGPSKGLVGPLADARAEFAERLERTTRDLDRAQSGLSQFSALLGGSARYLVLAANNAEMRAGSGMFLSAGELLIEQGRLSLTKMSSVTDIGILDAGEIAVDPEVQATWGWAQPGRDLRDIGVSPRFDVSADMAARMWEKTRGVQIDGVMAVDPIVLKALLKAVGPVQVNGRNIGPNNVVDQLLHQQYVDFEADADRDRAGRQAVMGAVAQAAFLSFDSFKWDASTLANGLAQAAQGRHLMLWSRDQAMQEAWVKAGIAGVLEEQSLMVSVLNYSGTKLDQYLNIDASMTLTADTAGTRVKLTLLLANNTPHDQPSYIIGPFPGGDLTAGTYGGVVMANVPASATDLKIEGGDYLSVYGPDGKTQVIGESFTLEAGAKRKVTVTFHLPKGDQVLRIEPAARVPSMKWKVGKETFDSEAPRWVKW